MSQYKMDGKYIIFVDALFNIHLIYTRRWSLYKLYACWIEVKTILHFYKSLGQLVEINENNRMQWRLSVREGHATLPLWGQLLVQMKINRYYISREWTL